MVRDIIFGDAVLSYKVKTSQNHQKEVRSTELPTLKHFISSYKFHEIVLFSENNIMIVLFKPFLNGPNSIEKYFLFWKFYFQTLKTIKTIIFFNSKIKQIVAFDGVQLGYSQLYLKMTSK